MIEQVAWPLPLRVLGELLGFPREDLGQLHEWGTDWLLLQQPGSIEQRVRHARGLVALQRYMVDALEEREREPRDDLLGALMAARAESDDPLSLDAVAGLPLDLMVAGHVTVTRAIGSALALVFRHPSCASSCSIRRSLRPRSRRCCGSSRRPRGSSASRLGRSRSAASSCPPAPA